MHFSLSNVALAVIAVATSFVHADPPTPPSPTNSPTKPACTRNFRGSFQQLQAQQQIVIREFADLFFGQKNAQLAFDKYIPTKYINHNPSTQTGRQNALDFLVPALQNPDISYDHITAFAGENFGLIHYRFKFAGNNTAGMDKFRFVGTCIVEHWDVLQQIAGLEANPIAFF